MADSTPRARAVPAGRLLRRLPRHPLRLLPTLAVCLAACDPPYPPAPETARIPVVDTLHGVEFTDDYRWLEDQESAETRAWIDEQNAYAEQVVGDTPLRADLEGRLRELMDAPGAIFPRRAGDYEYFSFRKPGREVGAIYRRPAPDEPREAPTDPDGEFEVVIDPLDLRDDATTSVSIVDFSPDGDLMIYAIRDGGRDEREYRVRDLESGEDLPDRLPTYLYGNVSFNPGGDGFHYSRRSRETGARIRHHRLGTDLEQDEELFGEGHGPERFVGFSQGGDGRWLVYTVQHGWARTDVYLHDLRSGTAPAPLIVGAPARFSTRFVEDELYLLTNLDAPRNRILAVDLENPEPDPAAWREVLPEGEDLLTGYRFIGDDLYADYLRDVSSRIVRYGPDGVVKNEIPIPAHHVATLRSHGDDGNEALLTLTSLLTPSTILKLDLETMETEEWRPSSVPFDGSEYELKQIWYTSEDGTRAPMYIAHRTGLVLDGQSPALLYGYGGFNVNLLPRFDARAAAWLEHGGVYAMATLRGGGEFGEEWHRAGMLENKPNVFADFIAAAEWLVDNGYTNPNRLAIRGGSNGGLLVGASLTQRPDLFRAVYCGLPDLDMVRFHQFTDANNMPALLEYGNAAVAEEFEVLRTFSPYQNVRDGVDYPAVMLTQGDLDTRVPPLQARKMAARLQAASSSGLPVILDYDPRTGHAGGRSFSRNVRNAAMELAFLLQQLGVSESETGS
ncbi:prolyl oligopeptidase family serine peptidase [Candidatus Palauibacter sp.]|uniref:prolyl oligopeptidase family serine peptidase n=1 Tax=Candidatus Palauibacter sp. TaxID=3101350 RepID=UPI003B01A2EB